MAILNREQFNFESNCELTEFETNRRVVNNVQYNKYHGVMEGYFLDDEARWSVWVLKRNSLDKWGTQHGIEVNFIYPKPYTGEELS